MHKPLGVLASSENPDKLAASITGSIIAVSSLIILGAGHLGFPLTVEQVTNFAGELGAAGGAIYALFGLLRKMVIAIHDKASTPSA